MSHTIELPDELYSALERYANERGETVESAVLAWATAVLSAPKADLGPQRAPMYNPADDPLAEFLGTGELTSPDAIRRHDEVFGAEDSDGRNK